MKSSQTSSRHAARIDPAQHTKSVIACVDASEQASKIIPHAIVVASALGLPVTLLRVLEARLGDVHPDPIEWNLRRHAARDVLKRLAAADARDAGSINLELVDGQVVDEICRWTQEHFADLIVLGTHGERGPLAGDLGSTARGVLARWAGSVLLVPAGTPEKRAVRYRRILVPLDGSQWAESVMPVAQRLAHALGAELLLAHVVPVPELTQVGPPEAEDLELRDRVVGRNERVGQAYIERIRGQVVEKGVRVRALTIRGEDVRSSLAQLIRAEGVDLVILSARGHGGARLTDVRHGKVAEYLLTHSATPMLIVRSVAPSDAFRAPVRLALATGATT